MDARPWRFLEDRTDKLHVEERMAGLFYLAGDACDKSDTDVLGGDSTPS